MILFVDGVRCQNFIDIIESVSKSVLEASCLPSSSHYRFFLCACVHMIEGPSIPSILKSIELCLICQCGSSELHVTWTDFSAGVRVRVCGGGAFLCSENPSTDGEYISSASL